MKTQIADYFYYLIVCCSFKINQINMTEANSKMVDSSVVLEKALHSWTIIDLSNLQKELDEKAIDIQDYQKESLVDRKELANQTKSFKKLEDEEKLEKFNTLLKSYQNVIDSMNKKTKNIENLFFKVYRSIAEAPDPKPLLKSSLDTLATVYELTKVKEENKILEEKLLKFADYDKLKEQIQTTETQMKTINDAELEAKDSEWKSLLEERESNWKKNEEELESVIESLRKDIQDREVNEKMLKLRLKKKSEALGEEYNEDAEEDNVVAKDEFGTGNVNNSLVESLKKDLECSKERVQSLQSRNEELRKNASLLNSRIDIEVKKTKKENDKQISNLESENSMLVAKLSHERKTSTKLNEEIKAINDKFNKEITQLNTDIDNLKKIKNERSDYEEIKKELELLKQIQFGDKSDNSDTNNEFETDSVARIESAIVQRNKKLNNDLIQLRRVNEESSKKIEDFSAKIEQLEKEISVLKDTNVRLENDLINFEHTGNNNDDKWETMSMISSIAGTNNGKNNNHNRNVSPAASIAGGTDDNRSIIMGGGGNSSDSSLLPIITQQRDRFRNRNKELEEENKKHFSKIVELKREINSLKNDNRELYEKIRFLQYHQNAQNIQQNGGDIESRYKVDYEHDLHPIEQFRLMETKRINSKITPWDRIFIQVTKTVLSTPLTRWLFVAYCLSLHLLVMILTLSLMGGSANSTTTYQTSSSLASSGNTQNIDSKLL